MKAVSLLLPLLLCSCALRNTNNVILYTNPATTAGAIIDSLDALSLRHDWIIGPDSSISAIVRGMDDTSRGSPEIIALHDTLLQHLTLRRVVALERLLVQLQGRHRYYSRTPTLSGRIIDRFYSREWERITVDSLQLRGYLKKAALLDDYINRTNISRIEPRYLDRFRDASPELVDQLGQMYSSEEDPLIRRSVAAILAFQTESTVADAYVLENISEFHVWDPANFRRQGDSLFYQAVADRVRKSTSVWDRELLMQILERGEPEVTLPALRRLLGGGRTAYVDYIPRGWHNYERIEVSVGEYAERIIYRASQPDPVPYGNDSGSAGANTNRGLAALDEVITSIERICTQDSDDTTRQGGDLWDEDRILTHMIGYDSVLYENGRVNYQRLYDHLTYPFDPSFRLCESPEVGLQHLLLFLQLQFRDDLAEMLTSGEAAGSLFGEVYRYWMQNPGWSGHWPDDPTIPIADERRFWLDFLVERGYAEPVIFRDAGVTAE